MVEAEDANSPEEPRLPRGLSIAALVLAIPGLAVPFLGVVAVVLAVVSLVRGYTGRAGGRWIALAGLVVGGAGTFTSFVVAVALVVPMTITSGHRGINYDMGAAANLRACATAQTMYAKTDWNGDDKKEYAHPFTNLYADASAGNKEHKLIDRALRDAAGPAGQPKVGYLFQDCRTIGGKPIDWTTDYAMCAMPAAYGRTGRRTFIVGTDGRVLGKDLGKGTKFVDDFPADPEAAGWQEAD
jgi:uncharacterized membrane protein